MTLKEFLWDSRVESLRVRIVYGLVILPLYLIAFLFSFVLVRFAFISQTLLSVALAIAFFYTTDLVVTLVMRKARKRFWRWFDKTVRERTEPDNRMFDASIEELRRETREMTHMIAKKVELTPEKEMLLNIALDNALKGVKVNGQDKSDE